MEKLVIIDGKSVFYRGYYAMGALSTKEGVATGGIYGFAVIALELIERIRPKKVVVAWDKAGTSIRKRKEIFKDYKAGRARPPEDFYAQIPLLKDLVLELGWEWLECDDYEADDIIGTLSRQAEKEGNLETIIISSDLDMLQVVGEKTKMYRLLKGFSELEEIDVSKIEEKYGILKSQFLDLKALKGDASDNIPGVPGVGEKTAVKLLVEYGDLAGIYDNLEKIKGATRKKLEEGKESAIMSRRLAEIMFDAPVELVKVRELVVDKERIRQALLKLEFNSLIKKFIQKEGEEGGKIEGKRSLSWERVKVLDGGEGMEVFRGEGLGLFTVGEIWRSKKEGREVILSLDIKKLMHENKEARERILAGEEFWDLGQGRFLLDPLERDFEVKDLGVEYERQLAEFGKQEKLKQVLVNLDLPLVPILYRMEERGVMICREYFKDLEMEFRREVAEIEQKIYTEAGVEFNVNSPVQLSEVLFGKLGLETKGIKKTSRGYSTGVKELEKLKAKHPIIELIMEFREASKLLNTYIGPMQEQATMDGRIHTTFTQNVTATGRLSSVAPNLQNIPVRTEEGKRIRQGFVAGPGKVLVSADYAQFELRLAAVLAGDEKLIEDFNRGIDIHTKTAAEVFGVKMEEVEKGQRRAAKVINFGVLYGMSARGLAEAAEMNFYEAKRFIEGYFELRRPIRVFLDGILERARNLGYVETYFGRRRPTPDVKSANFIVRSGAERAAQNMPIQGTEADLMKKAMIMVEKRLPEGAEMILQIHDSIIVECDEGKREEVMGVLKEVMEGVAPELKIKLEVEVVSGKNWGEL